MNLYLGTLNHILTVYVGPVEPANNIDPAKVCNQIVCEEHSGIPGDKITFRIHAEDLEAFKVAFRKGEANGEV